MTRKLLKDALSMCLRTRGTVMPTSFAEAYSVSVARVEAMLEELRSEGAAERGRAYFVLGARDTTEQYRMYNAIEGVTIP